MKNIILLNKKEGKTPLQVLENFRQKHKKYKDVKMTYAGRLDPMASGLLLVLTGEEIKNKEKYLALNKEYNFKVLFGFATDTYDVLGKVVNTNFAFFPKIEKEIKRNLKSFLGENFQKYPKYSSKTVKGKPLFVYAREGEYVDIPERVVFIQKLKLEKITEINNKKLFANIKKRIEKVDGDFRQEEILDIWKGLILDKPNKFFVAHLKIKCSSGTYVRSVANTLGDMVGIPALAFSIRRTRVGKYVI
ncbi:MAG: hypothetical protein WC870_01530 [Candidatus Paceibacterota bacterium]